MRFLFLAFLALALGPLVFASQLKSGLYSFKTETAASEGASLSITGSVVIFPQFSEKGNLYSLTVQELSFSSEAFPLSLDLPFQFVRLDNGLIEFVNVHPAESLEMKNLKKSIVEALQTSLITHAHVSTEAGAAGVRKVHYARASKSSGAIDFTSSFELSDFTSFAEHSGLEAGRVTLSGRKTVRVAEEDQSVIEAQATVQIQKGDDIRVVSTTSIQFVSGDIAMIDMIQEGPFNQETLVHELDPASRPAQLKARLPSIPTLLSLLTSPKTSTKDAIRARAQLVLLMNLDEAALAEGLAFLTIELEKSADLRAASLAYTTLARVNAMEAQVYLSQEISKTSDVARLSVLLKSLTALQNPFAPIILVKTLQQVQFPKELEPLVELTLAHVAKFLGKEEARDVITPFIKRLNVAMTDADKIHLLYIIGNVGEKAPVELLLPFLFDPSAQVRTAALASLRSHIHLAEIQDALASFLTKRENTESASIMTSLVSAMKQNMKKNNLSFGKLHLSLNALASPLKEVKELLSQLAPLPETAVLGKSTTSIWNSTNDPNFDLISPAYERQQDVNRYPEYNGYLMAAQYGPRPANLKIATGVFSGFGGDGCLAGNFKIFDKLYTETNLVGDVLVLADLYVYFLTFNNEFDSRLYGLINGNVIIDLKISSNCSDDEFNIFSGEVEIIFWETEIPLDIGNVYIFADSAAFLEFDVGYKICLLTGNPFVELYLTGEIALAVDAGATVTALGIVRAGIEFQAYFNYRIGPDTQLGTRNNAAGELVCAACIGIFYGYEDQTAYGGLFLQRREGLGWGEKNPIPLFQYLEPGVPFPTLIIETCAETEQSQPSFIKERI